MYVGRIVTVALTEDGRLCAGYRVSSRSFPNRTAVLRERVASIVPKPGHEADVIKNPYIAYNCLHVVCDGQVAIVSNGSHTDPIAEKISTGFPVRDALAYTLIALDFEKDQYNTPRIAAVVDKRDGSGWLGVVRDNGIEVKRMPLRKGACFYVATYDENTIDDNLRDHFTAANAEAACDELLYKGVFAERTNPVSAVAAFAVASGFELAAKDAVGA